MQIKKFEAPTIQEALEAIKRELGPEAIILQTKQNKRGFGLLSKTSVEVTAAVAEKALQKKKVLDEAMPDYAKNTVQKLPATQQTKIINTYAGDLIDRVARKTKDRVELSSRSATVGAPATRAPKQITTRRYADIGEPEIAAAPPVAQKAVQNLANQARSAPAVERELEHLRRMVEELQSNSGGTRSDEGPFKSQTLTEGFELLTLNGVDRTVAHGILKSVAQKLGEAGIRNAEEVLDTVAITIGEKVAIAPFLEPIQAGSGVHTIALVGPTGVGKTTTIAKIASSAILDKKLKVALVNLDQFKIGASDQLESYAKILRIPFRSVENTTELQNVLQDFKNFDLILIDTTGRSQKDDESLKEMETTLKSVPSIQTQLVLSATTRDMDLMDMGRRFLRFEPKTVILSKLDETTAHGTLLNVASRLGLPLSYLATGQRVPEDIEAASTERAIALVMDL